MSGPCYQCSWDNFKCEKLDISECNEQVCYFCGKKSDTPIMKNDLEFWASPHTSDLTLECKVSVKLTDSCFPCKKINISRATMCPECSKILQDRLDDVIYSMIEKYQLPKNR